MEHKERHPAKGKLLLLRLSRLGSGIYARLDPVKLEELGLQKGDRLLVRVEEVI